jgi:hypothetical protein
VELHTVVEELPSGETGDMVPIVLLMIDVEMVPSTDPGIVVVDDIVVAVLPTDVETELGAVDTGVAAMAGGGGAGTAGGGGAGTVEPGSVDKNEVAGVADSVGIGAVVLFVMDADEVDGAAGIVGAAVPRVPPTADMEVTGTAGVVVANCPDGVAQVTTVPGVVGSEASGTGASVVSGAPSWVAAENGLGPLSGEDRTVPGVDGRLIAVLPMVETCARQAWAPSSRVAAVNCKRRIANSFLRAGLACRRFTH